MPVPPVRSPVLTTEMLSVVLDSSIAVWPGPTLMSWSFVKSTSALTIALAGRNARLARSPPTL